MTSAALRRVAERLRKFSLDLPEAWEDFPWDERVAKVGKKVFVFGPHVTADGVGLSVKLPDSRDQALSLPGAEPTGYGLGRAGWVTVRFGPGDRPPTAVLCDWIEESYRAVAPKSLVARLGGSQESSTD